MIYGLAWYGHLSHSALIKYVNENISKTIKISQWNMYVADYILRPAFEVTDNWLLRK